MIGQPKLEDRAEQPYVGIRTQAPVQELGAGVIPQSIGQVAAWLGKQGVASTGAPFIRYHVIDMNSKLDIEVGWPVANVLPGDGRITGGVLPAGRYASLVYTGDYPGLMEANAALLDWGAKNGLKWDSSVTDQGDAFGARFESYLTDPAVEPNPAKWETEVAIRVADDHP